MKTRQKEIETIIEALDEVVNGDDNNA